MDRNNAPDVLRNVDAALAAFPECPYHLVRRAAAIQLHDTDEGPTLEDAESALLRAHDADPRYIDALGDLAHFYDIILPDRKKAAYFARMCLEQAQRLVDEMNEIINDSEASSG